MPTNISPSESEGTKWMKLQLWVRQACENAGITAGGDDPLLSDISQSDSEGVKWAKLQRWVALLAENISGGGGGGGTATALKTARTLTIGSTGKPFDGSANVAWTLAEIGADPSGTASGAVSTHNSATDSHSDLRTLIAGKQDSLTISAVGEAMLALATPAAQKIPRINPNGSVTLIDVPSATLADEITTDAPTAYWQLTETGGNLADSAGGGRTLTVTGSPVYAFCQLVRNLTSKGLKFVPGAYASRASDNLGVTPPWTGSWSLEFVVMLPEDLEEELGCFTYGTSGETEAGNYQIFATITTARKLNLIWEYGAGNNVTFSPQIVLPIGFKAHIVWTKDAVNKIVKCFVNGICAYSYSYTQEPTGGSSSTIDVGRSSTGATTTGVLGHVAVYMGAVLSDARVMAHAVAAGVA